MEIFHSKYLQTIYYVKTLNRKRFHSVQSVERLIEESQALIRCQNVFTVKDIIKIKCYFT